MAERCPIKRINCPYKNKRCVVTKHHLYWPERAYETPLEKEFRNLPQNIALERRCDHDDIHEFIDPPQKPGVDVMIKAIGQIATQKDERNISRDTYPRAA